MEGDEGGLSGEEGREVVEVRVCEARGRRSGGRRRGGYRDRHGGGCGEGCCGGASRSLELICRDYEEHHLILKDIND